MIIKSNGGILLLLSQETLDASCGTQREIHLTVPHHVLLQLSSCSLVLPSSFATGKALSLWHEKSLFSSIPPSTSLCLRAGNEQIQRCLNQEVTLDDDDKLESFGNKSFRHSLKNDTKNISHFNFPVLTAAEHIYLPSFCCSPLPATRLEQFKRDKAIFCLWHHKGQVWRLKGHGGQKHALGHHVLYQASRWPGRKSFWNRARKQRPICYFRV